MNGTSKTVWYDTVTGRIKRAGWLTDGTIVNGVVDRLGMRRVALYVVTRPTKMILQSGSTKLVAGPDLVVDLKESRRGSMLVAASGGIEIKAFERDQRLSRDEQSWNFVAFIAHALTDESEQRRLIELWSAE